MCSMMMFRLRGGIRVQPFYIMRILNIGLHKLTPGIYAVVCVFFGFFYFIEALSYPL